MRIKNPEIKDSITNELQLLEDIISSPEKFDNATFLEILRTQSNFASFSSLERSILRVSLNTHKTYADEFSKLGFEHLNNLRSLAYHKLINLKKAPQKSTKESLNEKILKLSNEIKQLEKQNLKLVKAFTDIQYTLDFRHKSKNVQFI